MKEGGEKREALETLHHHLARMVHVGHQTLRHTQNHLKQWLGDTLYYIAFTLLIPGCIVAVWSLFGTLLMIQFDPLRAALLWLLWLGLWVFAGVRDAQGGGEGAVDRALNGEI